MTEHSTKIGGSSAGRAIKCPGSIPLAAKISTPSNEYMREGTALHECMELLLDDPELETSALIGREFVIDDETVTITQEHHDEAILPALQAFDEFLDQLEKATGEEPEFEVEARVEFAPPLAGCFGTVDVIGRAGKIPFVLDWKFGQGVGVYAKDNTQLNFYASAACDSPNTRDLLDTDSETVWGAIIQPRCREVEILQVEPIAREELADLKTQLGIALHDSVRGTAAMQSGSHCKWCPVKPTCPLLHDQAVGLVEKEVENISVEELEEDLRLAADLEGWIKAVRTKAHQLLEAGTPIPGWKLVAKRATRKWADVDKLLAFARKKQLVKKLFPQKPVGVPAAMKIVKDLPEELVVKTSSGTTLAPEDDKRPAVQSTAGLAAVAKKAGL